MAVYRPKARSQGLSNTAALVRLGIPPAQGEGHMMVTRASPSPPQERPAGFARDSSPDTPGPSPAQVITQG